MYSVNRHNTPEKALLEINKTFKEKKESLHLIFYETLVELPQEIGRLTHLKHLTVGPSNLTSIPVEIKLLINLVSIDFTNSKITFLPTEIGLLTNLTSISLSHNKVTMLPTEIGNLTKLTSLNLIRNALSSLPTQIGLLTLLNDLNISLNGLPTLPNEIWNLTNLTRFELQFNQLTALSPEIGRMTKLVKLTLYGNRLTSLPTTIGLLVNLTEIDVDKNELTSLPAEIGRLSQLTKLSIADNRDIRELPMSIGDMPSLLEIQMAGTAIPNTMFGLIIRQCRQLRDKVELNDLPLRLMKWRAYGDASPFNLELTVGQKSTLNEWLLRLERTNDFKSGQAQLANIVCAILKDLRHREFSEFFFNQAEENNTCCSDRASMSLNEVYTSWVLLCKSPNLPQREKLNLLAGVAKTLRLRKALQFQIDQHENALRRTNPTYPGELESVEIFLYYESSLKAELQLETAIKGMAHISIGYRNWINPQALVQDVKQNFYEELIEIPLFAKMMQNQWDAIQAEFQVKFSRLGECPAGSEHDPKVLNYQVRVGELMQACKEKKIMVSRAAF